MNNHFVFFKTKVTVSIGVVKIRDNEIEERMNIEELMIRSDETLYKAKEKGRDRIEETGIR